MELANVTRREALDYLLTSLLALQSGCGKRVAPAMRSIQEPLCYRLFAAAASAAPRSLPQWHHSREIQQATGLRINPGQALHSQLLLGSCEQLGSWIPVILPEVRRFLGFRSPAEWSGHHPYLADLFGQFYRHPKVRSLPALLWLMPVYMSTLHGLQINKIRPIDRVTKHNALDLCTASLPRFALRFSPGSAHPRVNLDLRSIPFDQAQRHGSRSSHRILWMERLRSGVLRDGTPLRVAFENNFGQADPDDDQGCVDGGYYPAHDGLLVRGPHGRTRYIRFGVMVLARVQPLGDWSQGCVDQVVIPIHPARGTTVDLNTVSRDVELFLRHYPGLHEFVCQALDQGNAA